MMLDKLIFVFIFFFVGFFASALTAFVVIFLWLKRKKQNQGGSLISMGGVLIGGIGGAIAAVTGIVLVLLDRYQWLNLGNFGKYAFYGLGSIMVLGFISGLVSKIKTNKPSK